MRNRSDLGFSDRASILKMYVLKAKKVTQPLSKAKVSKYFLAYHNLLGTKVSSPSPFILLTQTRSETVCQEQTSSTCLSNMKLKMKIPLVVNFCVLQFFSFAIFLKMMKGRTAKHLGKLDADIVDV